MLSFVRRFARVFTIGAISAVTAPIAAVLTIITALVVLPLPATIPPPRLAVGSRASVVLDINGNQIASFSEFNQQIPVSPSDIPLVLKEAVISAEDRNFYHHGGIDFRGTLRALIADAQCHCITQGGSTIAQQYVKNAYTGNRRSVVRKIKEAILASELARKETKDQILFEYLNAIYFGGGAYGVGAASETYFHKDVADLTLGEAALLAGVIPAPSLYDPRTNPKLAEERRELVLRDMLDQGYITQPAYNAARVAQVYPGDKVNLLPRGAPATLVYPAQTQPVRYPYFVDYVRRYLELDPRVGPSLLYRGGLRIQTTIDPAMEAAAEAAINHTLAGTSDPLEMALVSVEPQTGFVKAMVGGRDFARDQTNLALGGCEAPPPNVTVLVTATCSAGQTPEGGGTGRQAGSAFKPFTLAAAFENGVQPSEGFAAPACYTPPGGIPGRDTICNAEPASFGHLTLRVATWESVNTVFAQLILDRRVGVQRVAEMAKRLGITSAWYSPQVHGASYTLGTVGMSPLDIASAYGVFANHGLRMAPTPVVLVEDPSHKILIDNRPGPNGPIGQQVISSAIADNVTDVLRGVITSGTGISANIGRPAAGKTGTASTGNSYSDAWFVGYVPTLSTAVWMGNADAESHSLRGTKGVYAVYGATFSAPTWGAYMKAVLQNVPPTDFNQPAPLTPVANELDREARGGIDPGEPSYPVEIGSGGPYQYGPEPPQAVAPPPPTTLAPFGPTTTEPFGGGSGAGGGGVGGGGGGPPGLGSTPSFGAP